MSRLLPPTPLIVKPFARFCDRQRQILNKKHIKKIVSVYLSLLAVAATCANAQTDVQGFRANSSVAVKNICHHDPDGCTRPTFPKRPFPRPFPKPDGGCPFFHNIAKPVLTDLAVREGGCIVRPGGHSPKHDPLPVIA